MLMKYCILAIFGLVSLSMAAEPAYYTLDDFLQGAKRNPNKCVGKGDTFKCVGYENIDGAVFNVKTKHHYSYVRNDFSESYTEFVCANFYVEEYAGNESIICDDPTLLKNVECYTSGVKIEDYDELGILVDEKMVDKADAALCRNAFHHQYGNDNGKPYDGLNVKGRSTTAGKQNSGSYDLRKNAKFTKDIEKVLMDVAGMQTTGKTVLGGRRRADYSGFSEGYAEGGSGDIGDGYAGLLGGGGGIATKAKGSIKTPSERDIKIIKGDRSAADIAKTIRQRTPGLRHIYNKCLKKKPGFYGDVTLKLSVAPSGEVTSISVVSSTTGFSEFDGEIKSAVGRWKFSKDYGKSTTVTIPFTFSE